MSVAQCGEQVVILVPPLAPYTTEPFCVAKYEMKDDGDGNAVSQMEGQFLILTSGSSVTKCEDIDSASIKYDLITNNEWQTIARNIEGVASNWSGGAIGSVGGINTGAIKNGEYNILTSSDDNPCFGLTIPDGETCDQSTWHKKRRTHTLSNGEIIWDLSGNNTETIKDNFSFKNQQNEDTITDFYTSVKHISLIAPINDINLKISSYYELRLDENNPRVYTRIEFPQRSVKELFGPAGVYQDLNTPPAGGLGSVDPLGSNLLYIKRGHDGIFGASVSSALNPYYPVSFRCVYRP